MYNITVHNNSPSVCVCLLPFLLSLNKSYADMHTYAHATLEAKLVQVLAISGEAITPLSCTHTNFIALFHNMSLTRILNAVVISCPNPPSLNEQAITIGFSPVPMAYQHCPKPASSPAFSSASASLSDSLLFPCTSSPFHCGCRLSLFLLPLCSLSLSLLPSLSSGLFWVLDRSLSQWLINTGIDPLAKCL